MVFLISLSAVITVDVYCIQVVGVQFTGRKQSKEDRRGKDAS
jgi:hypothetical protein